MRTVEETLDIHSHHKCRNYSKNSRKYSQFKNFISNKPYIFFIWLIGIGAGKIIIGGNELSTFRGGSLGVGLTMKLNSAISASLECLYQDNNSTNDDYEDSLSGIQLGIQYLFQTEAHILSPWLENGLLISPRKSCANLLEHDLIKPQLCHVFGLYVSTFR